MGAAGAVRAGAAGKSSMPWGEEGSRRSARWLSWRLPGRQLLRPIHWIWKIF